MVAEGYVTFKEMSESQDKVKKEILDSQENVKKSIMEHIERGDKQTEKLDNKVNNITDKVANLNDLVLPLTIAMKQTAENTKEISESLKDFTKSQSTTNGIVYDRLHAQDLSIEGLKNITSGIAEKKKYNVSVVVALISLVGVFIAGLFQLAPILFG